MPIYYIFYESDWKRFVGYALVLLFTVAYRKLYFNTKSFSKWLIIQVLIILILAVFYNINNIFLGFFPANFIGWFTDKKKFYNALILFAIAIIIPLFLHSDVFFSASMLYFIPFIVIMFISPFGIRSMNSKLELEQKLNEANETIKELVKREERMRIARDLHDTLGHTLSLITLKSQLVGKLITKDSEKALTEVKAIERTSRAALAQVRELVSDMRTISVEEELTHAKSILEAANISYELQGDSKLKGIPELTQNILSLCLREAVTNVVKHSQAQKCLVCILEKAGEILLSIHDDGKGLNSNNKYGNGLKGMTERLVLIDGDLNLTSENGTKLMITVPVIVKEREAGVIS